MNLEATEGEKIWIWGMIFVIQLAMKMRVSPLVEIWKVKVHLGTL